MLNVKNLKQTSRGLCLSMLAVVLVIVVGTVRLVGANASNVFSSVASGIQ